MNVLLFGLGLFDQSLALGVNALGEDSSVFHVSATLLFVDTTRSARREGALAFGSDNGLRVVGLCVVGQPHDLLLRPTCDLLF